MKNLFLVFFIILLQACVPNVKSVKNDENGNFRFVSRDMDELIYRSPGMLWNGIQYAGYAYSLNFIEKNLHKKAVYHSLNQALDGEFVYWKSDRKYFSGKVRVVHSYPTSNGYCRIYQTYITKNTTTHFFTNQACKSFNGDWVFNR